jgi:ATP-dependent exoDNAse (exonuclease V) beta subunit
MKFPPLTVIEASAGTGKTFSLVTRLLRLIFNVTEPERIVALTFSRMAAGEIFNSFIERLSKAADDEKVAKEEKWGSFRVRIDDLPVEDHPLFLLPADAAR